MAKKFYAVRNGNKTGIFENWDDCKAQVFGFKGAIYKSFPTMAEAEEYMSGNAALSSKIHQNSRPLEDGEFIVYSDGSFVVDLNYSYAFAVIDGNDNLVYHENGVGKDEQAKKLRNVAGEIEAVVKAVEYAANNNLKIIVHYDYQGIESWVDGSWNAGNHYTKKYVEFMKKHTGRYEFVKVKGHSNLKWNDFVDKLAREALGI